MSNFLIVKNMNVHATIGGRQNIVTMKTKSELGVWEPSGTTPGRVVMNKARPGVLWQQQECQE